MGGQLQRLSPLLRIPSSCSPNLTGEFMPIKTHNLGYPRIGKNRELKKAIEAYWGSRLPAVELQQIIATLRQRNWLKQKEAGIELIPSNDFTLYDQVLDHICLLGCQPERFVKKSLVFGMDDYFSMARGSANAEAMEMTKWFDTNYHYLVPELKKNQTFQLASTKPVDEFYEALALGIKTKPVLLGPVSFLRLAKCVGTSFDKLTLLPKLIPIYALLLQELKRIGVEWVQIDEPILAMDLNNEEQEAFISTYKILASSAPSIILCSYFGAYGSNLSLALSLPVNALHLDLCRGEEDFDFALENLSSRCLLSLGLVDGRNIWKNNFAHSLALIEKAKEKLGEARLWIAPSCSLLHSPLSLAMEDKPSGIPHELSRWMSFAEEKLIEVKTLAHLASVSNSKDTLEYQNNQDDIGHRKDHAALKIRSVQEKCENVKTEHLRRKSVFSQRKVVQQNKLQLPNFPTTTIGSFPQTEAVRQARANAKNGSWSMLQYRNFLKAETIRVVKLQEDLGLDVLVHGEFERNDMVEYFGEKLHGFTFSANGWVQSYGTRCVKPPIIFGDVCRREAMTVEWSSFAQAATTKPMKGMLTGPVTILKWSFVRDDQPLDVTARQIAWAIREEVLDLETAGLPIIQIDEPALREGMPLRPDAAKIYLKWAVEAFQLSASGVRDETQIHTHMCYCDFHEILDSVAAMDADVISLEAARSRMELLEAFVHFDYPNGVGPGIWDIHSPRIPTVIEMEKLLLKASERVEKGNLWVNPDCGLKTRGWPEVLQALEHMVTAAKLLRKVF